MERMKRILIGGTGMLIGTIGFHILVVLFGAPVIE